MDIEVVKENGLIVVIKENGLTSITIILILYV